MLIHPLTDKDIMRVKAAPPHAILVTGNDGSGRSEIGRMLAEALLQKSVVNHPYYIEISPEGRSISIEQIRDLHRFVGLKTTGKQAIRRVVLVVQANTMTSEAQNALLKLLEEPPADTVIIMTAKGDRTLKPTIYSRAQRLHVRPITREQARTYGEKMDSSSWERAFALSNGDSVLFEALMLEQSDHKLFELVQKAKSLLAADKYQRLLQTDELSKDKDVMTQLLAALKRVVAAGLETSVQKNNQIASKRWLKAYQSIHRAQADAAANTNSKLLLDELFLTI